jgi:hypothetical protein
MYKLFTFSYFFFNPKKNNILGSDSLYENKHI